MSTPPFLTPPAPVLAPTRGYDRGFTWLYDAPPLPPGSGVTLIPVYWDGLPLNLGDDPATGLCTAVENVEGWLDSPPLDGHDTARAIADGSAWGPKTLGARVIAITGAATGPRDQLGYLRQQLAARAAARSPAQLVIANAGGMGKTLTADVRADTDQLKVTPIGHTGFRWQITLTAADPLLYDYDWQEADLANAGPGGTGRTYQRAYSWVYAQPYLPNSAELTNDGNVPAPVIALYTGDLSQSTLADEAGNAIMVAALDTAMQIRLDTSTLAAEADGGLSRASFILPGSVPMVIPPMSTVRWHLYATGGGSLTLAWRSTWV